MRPIFDTLAYALVAPVAPLSGDRPAAGTAAPLRMTGGPT